MAGPKVEIVESTFGNFLVFAEDFDIAEQLCQNGVHDLDVIKAGIVDKRHLYANSTVR